MKTIPTIIPTLLLFFISLNLAAADCQEIRRQYQCPGNEKYPIHLSFDDGPANLTPALLDLLKKEQIPATFFIIAERIDCQPHRKRCLAGNERACQSLTYCQQHRNTLQRTVQEGHTIGSHSYNHLHLSALSQPAMEQQISRSRRLLSPWFNTNPPLFRLPYGDGWFNRAEKLAVLQTLKKYGFKHIAWEMSAFDWRKADQQDDRILQTVMHEICTKKRGVILFHDGDSEKEHIGRTFTVTHMAKWIPAMRCVADFKPLTYFYKDIEVIRK